MDEDFFRRNEDAILRAQHPLYDAFCREEEDEESDSYEDEMTRADFERDLRDER